MLSKKAMTLAWITDRTAELCRKGGVVLTDQAGAPVKVKASSWRAGGVLNLREAHVGDAVLKAAGRWSSNAHLSYSFVRKLDLKAATSKAVAASEAAATMAANNNNNLGN